MSAADAQRVHDLGTERRAELLADLFRGSSTRGHLRGDATVRGPLRPADLLAHVQGETRFGAVPFSDAERVTWGCIDLDVRLWGVEPDDPEALAIVDAIVQALALRGLRAVPERSRSKGWHVWVFLDRPVLARDLRDLLRGIALESGARDEADLICPRQDRIDGDGIGNGTYLPLFGGDREPFTRFHQWNEDGDLLPVEDGDLAGFLRDLAEHRSPADRVPREKATDGEAEGDHPCAWIIDELAEAGLPLEAVVFCDGANPDRARTLFCCPLHKATKKRRRGGSAVFWADGRGQCSSAKCGKRWRSVAEFIDLAGAAQATIRSYLEIAPDRDELEGLAAAPPIVPVVTHLLYPNITAPLVGQTGTGKTTAAGRASVDLAYGREPWTGNHDGRDPRRVLFISKDDTTLSLVKKLIALAPDDAWMADGRITIIGKEKRPSRIDSAGLEILGNTIAEGRFDVFVLDPYQHFLPSDWSVNDDAGAQYAIENLDAMANSLHVAGLLIHHPRKRAPKAKAPMDMTKAERLEEIRGSSVLAQLARAVATLWEVEPGRRMLDAVVNDVPPLQELYFETSTIGDDSIRWELSGAPSSAEQEQMRARLFDLEPGAYNLSELARRLFGIQGKPSGKRRTDAKGYAKRIAEQHPQRFRVQPNGSLDVLGGDDRDL